MDRQIRVTTERDTSPRVVETIYPPTYQNSQRSLTSAPENIERIELYENSVKTRSASSSPISSVASPTWQEVLRSSISERSNTLVSSRPHSVAFSWTHTIAPEDEEQPGLELAKDLDAGLEILPYDGNFDKEVYIPEEMEAMEKEVVEELKTVQRTWNWRRNFLFGFQRRWCLWAAAGILLMAIGVGIGLLAVKFSQNQHAAATSRFQSGGHLDPKFYSSRGAFNGSGLAAACQTFPGHAEESVVLYYQHHSGTIRWKYMKDEAWLGGADTEILAYDAKNGTPISAVAYENNEISTWHVFYLNDQNNIRQRSNDNITNQWRDGEINSLKLQAMDSDAVGMGACWYGEFYGDNDYTNFKSSKNANADPYHVGMRIWFASNATTFQQYGWRDGDHEWDYQRSWNGKNGHAGIGCYSWAPGSTTYVMMLNQTNGLEVWWKDTNTNLTSTAKHPINKWTAAPVQLPWPVNQRTSLSYTQLLYAQSPLTHQFHTYNITFAAEATALRSNGTSNVTLPPPLKGQLPGIPGSRLASSEITDQNGKKEILVFYQMEGDDLVGFVRDVDKNNWAILDINAEGLASS